MNTREMAAKVTEFTKTVMTKYPLFSRPVFTKKAYAELNAITGRLGSVTTYRRNKPSV